MAKVTLRVYRNGDDVFLAWRTAELIPKCRGFALFRRRNGREETMPSYAGFENESWKPGDSRPTTTWPIQKFSWTDYTIKRGDSVQYRVVPMVRQSDGVKRLDQDLARASDWSPKVTLDPEVSESVSCFFNRGIVATQWVQRLLGADKSIKQRAAKLDEVIADMKHPYARNVLAGELREGLLALLARAKKEKLAVFAALFELTDKELTDALAALGARAFIVLADGSVPKTTGKRKPDDNDMSASGSRTDENAEARRALRKAHVQVHDRMTEGKFLAHNKLLVVCDKKGRPRWTWTGSTNWTPTGLCTQANNGILIEDGPLAACCRDQIQALARENGKSSKALAQTNSKPFNGALGARKATLWFTRTLKQVDLADASARIAQAPKTSGVLFLMFQTGAKGSLLEAILNRQNEESFYIHGVISSPPVVGGGGGKAPKLTPEQAVAKRVAFVHHGERVRYAPDLLLPFAQRASDRWFGEFVKKNGAHAIVHSKVIVLDPFGRHPVVMTGSHNMGKTASSKNDENLLIIEDDPLLAAAYAVNIMSIYDNFRWRYRVAAGSKWKGSFDNDRWQIDYIKGTKHPEVAFWVP
jgi:phosphatidylserine/phosphatidylglycerophosphate/cardiolipin synthase-like enzyme